MKLATGAVAFPAILAAVKLWTSNTISDWASTTVMVGAVFGLILLVLIVGVFLRRRQRRRVTAMRDSALW